MYKMTEGIEDSEVMIACVTPNYITKVSGKGPNGANDNCKVEFDYGIRRKGPEMFVPVVMETDCRDPKQWQGSLGAYLGNILYVDLSMDADHEGFERAVDRIVQEVRKRQKNQRKAAADTTVFSLFLSLALFENRLASYVSTFVYIHGFGINSFLG